MSNDHRACAAGAPRGGDGALRDGAERGWVREHGNAMSRCAERSTVHEASADEVVGVDGSTLSYRDRLGRLRRQKNLIGAKIGRLTVRAFLGRDKAGRPVWIADCDCGNTGMEAPHAALLSKWKMSCGCRREETKEAWKMVNYRHGAKNGGRVSPEYRVWQSMKDRCLNPNNQDFGYYGGRGITVCDRWRDSF